MKLEDLQIVVDDLKYLADWGKGDTPNGEIRRGSAVLRRLLVEDVYGQAWRAVGKKKQPKLIAIDLSPILTSEYLREIIFALAAGVKFKGIQMACIILNNGNKAIGEFNPPLRKNGYPGEREFTLAEFLASPSGIVDGQIFTRREIIKYIANVRGGVHLSQKRKKAERKLVQKLSKIEKRIQVYTKDSLLATDGLLIELVAIGQAVGSSKDVQEFIQYVENMIK